MEIAVADPHDSMSDEDDEARALDEQENYSDDSEEGDESVEYMFKASNAEARVGTHPGIILEYV